MIACIGSDGSLFSAVLKGQLNEVVFYYYLSRLAQQLDIHYSNWRKDIVLLLDNCTSHVSKITQWFMTNMNIPVCFTGPASYKIVPVELLFGSLKSGRIVVGD